MEDTKHKQSLPTEFTLQRMPNVAHYKATNEMYSDVTLIVKNVPHPADTLVENMARILIDEFLKKTGAQGHGTQESWDAFEADPKRSVSAVAVVDGEAVSIPMDGKVQ